MRNFNPRGRSPEAFVSSSALPPVFRDPELSFGQPRFTKNQTIPEDEIRARAYCFEPHTPEKILMDLKTKPPTRRVVQLVTYADLPVEHAQAQLELHIRSHHPNEAQPAVEIVYLWKPADHRDHNDRAKKNLEAEAKRWKSRLEELPQKYR